MTVIAWDGKTLAADRQATCNGLVAVTTKIYKVRDCLIGATGDLDSARTIINWFIDGADIGKWPKCQEDKERWSGLLVITSDKQIHKYEREPYPFIIEDKYFAVGSGRDFAIAAMHLGKSAKEAVEIACELSNECGKGVDVLEVEA